MSANKTADPPKKPSTPANATQPKNPNPSTNGSPPKNPANSSKPVEKSLKNFNPLRSSMSINDIIDIKDKQQFAADLKEAGGKLVAVAFVTKWCDNCQNIEPTFLGLSRTYPDVAYLKVDIEALPELATAYGVTVQPTFIFLSNGKIVDSYQGFNSKQLKKAFRQLILGSAAEKKCCAIL